MKQSFHPCPGKIAVVFEASVALQRMDAAGLEVLKETETYEKAVNPWGLVVGVGDPRITDNGRLVETDIQPGEKVAISQVGRTLPLKTCDGEIDFIYVLPFEGILGRVERDCEKCGFTSRESVDDMECPACPKIIQPNDAERFATKMSKR